VDVINDVQCMVTHLRGRPNDVPMDEATLEARIAKGGIPLVSCFRWVTQLQREFLLGDPQRAVEHAERAKPLLWTFRSHIQSADYCFYGSLAMAEVYAGASPERQAELRETLRVNLSWLAHWAQSCPSTFAHKHALAAAESARIEGRDVEALRLYDQAIRGAEEHGFVQDQAIGNELAGRFHLSRGLDKFAQACLRDARECYVRWGAFAKVAQLDARHGLGRPPPRGQRSTIEASLEGLDLETILRMARSLSSEIVLDKLIEALMTIALEHAGADRGLLVLQQASGLRIEAQASTESHGVVVRQPGVPPTAQDLPETILEHVVRTRESVILDDARVRNAFSQDEYLSSTRPRSVLCVPLVKQTELIGILYLENTLASHVFTPARCSVLDLLSSQAAISLQNARLYTELQQEDSERRRAQEALRQSEERYALAVAGSTEGIFDWDLVTERVYLAQHTQELVGLAPGDSWRQRQEWRRLVSFHPADVELQRRGIKAHIAGEAPAYDVAFRIVLPDGTRWFRQRGIALRDASGKAVRMVGTVGDITDQKLAQEERLRLERRLRQAQRFEAMGTLAGGIAHDFNNILGAILGFGERALRATDKDSRLRRDIDSIVAAGERGRALVERILGFSRGVVNERTAVHVEKVVRETLDLLEAKLPVGVAIDASLGAGRAAMVGDPTHVHQILMNLGTNAVQAMPSGGSLMVSLMPENFSAVHIAHIGTVEAGDWLVLKVADTGTGIAPEIADRIFDPFFTTKEAGVGTGLGLSLVLRLVTEIGGAMDFSTTPGAGSAFTVYLPREGDAPDEREVTRPPLPRGNGQRLLVVDDEEPLLQLAIETLEELGYAPVGFTSSVAALDAFGADPDAFHAVIVDERMPGMSGTTLIREVRRMRPAVPALLVSGNLRGPNPGGVRGEGAVEVLGKPLSVSELAGVLARVLPASV
jgi:signal transduction histidine kinase/CheY-like chemotaxis protein